MLIQSNSKLIKNISVLKDTTIVYAYPLKGNEAVIGKNLAFIAAQKGNVLKVKKNMTPIFQGPVNLVQGGTGFISRIPVILEDGTYWGQISIVINGEELMKETGLYEKDSKRDFFYNRYRLQQPKD